MTEDFIPYVRKTEPVTRESFHAAMDRGEPMFPTTPEMVEWFEEWFELHPEEKQKLDREIEEMKIDRFDTMNFNSILLQAFFKELRPGKVVLASYNEATRTVYFKDPQSGKTHNYKL